MIGTFRPTEIGSFRPTQNGRFRPALTAFCEILFSYANIRLENIYYNFSFYVTLLSLYPLSFMNIFSLRSLQAGG